MTPDLDSGGVGEGGLAMGDCPVSLGEDSSIRWRGVWKSPEDAARLAETFEAVSENDWFRELASSYAKALRNAIAIQEDSYVG